MDSWIGPVAVTVSALAAAGSVVLAVYALRARRRAEAVVDRLSAPGRTVGAVEEEGDHA